MQLHIRHETRYRYERPVKYSVQSLHLTPRRDPSQRARCASTVAGSLCNSRSAVSRADSTSH